MRIRRSARWMAGFALALLGTWHPQQAAAITSTRVASALARPIYVCAPAGDDRLFVVEQRGVIKLLKNGSVLATPFLDIDVLVSNISGNDERGLLGMAFHPDYATNGFFYLNYTRVSDDATVIARYTVSGGNPDVADAGSASTVLTISQPFANHNGGCIQFGPDGYLYIGMGDGGFSDDPGNRAQNKLELLGKLLRIDVDSASPYAIPPTNPFFGDPNYRQEIWALGVRNPWRFSFDRQTGDVYIADVGQNDWEEIDFQPASGGGGENYGWRLMEGNHCNIPSSNCDDGDPVLTYPIHEYSHGSGCSITGGYVYRGSAITGLAGTYFFADWCAATIWSFRYDGTNLTEFTIRTSELAPGGGLSITNIASFGEDGFGEMYIVDRGSGANGEIYKIIPNPAGVPDGGKKRSGLGLLPSVPNPFAETTLLTLAVDQSSTVDVQVLDPSGRVLRVLESGAFAAGRHAVIWDGIDDAGREVPSGVYFVRASGSRGDAIQRVQLIR